MPWLALGFFIAALLYASVGFGGGSTYTALLALVGTNYLILPAISLLCNAVVVTGGTVQFARGGHIPWNRLLPFLITSAPLAWLGGKTPIKETTFLVILAFSLAFAGLALLFQREGIVEEPVQAPPVNGRDFIVGGVIGYLSGLVGIGGGIFLAPWLHFTRWASSKSIAGASAFFILINSLSGLLGQWQKLSGSAAMHDILGHWSLALGVGIGGFIGNQLGIRFFSPLLMRRVTAMLVLYIAGQLLWKVMS